MKNRLREQFGKNGLVRNKHSGFIKDIQIEANALALKLENERARERKSGVYCCAEYL